jgi:hypothetical protein
MWWRTDDHGGSEVRALRRVDDAGAYVVNAPRELNVVVRPNGDCTACATSASATALFDALEGRATTAGTRWSGRVHRASPSRSGSGSARRGQECRWHMATVIGTVLVSSVGELWAPKGTPPSMVVRDGLMEIGWKRLYETMVFRVDPSNVCAVPGCGCGAPIPITRIELDAASANTRSEARAAHMAMCAKWAEDQREDLGDGSTTTEDGDG